jgi:uncharacterized protein (DUF2062 family)
MSAVPGARARWRRRVLEVGVAQLHQGITPQKIALTVALGTVLGLFPILGTTTALCLLAGVLLKLNQPVMQLVNWIAAPLQLPGIYLFVRTGERLMHAPAASFSIATLLDSFKAAPLQFLRQYGLTGVRAIVAWMLIAPGIALVVYACLLPALVRLQARVTGRPHGA